MLSNLTNLPEVVEPILTLALMGIAGGVGFLFGTDTGKPPPEDGLSAEYLAVAIITAVCTVITTILAVVKFFKKRKNKK